MKISVNRPALWLAFVAAIATTESSQSKPNQTLARIIRECEEIGRQKKPPLLTRQCLSNQKGFLNVRRSHNPVFVVPWNFSQANRCPVRLARGEFRRRRSAAEGRHYGLVARLSSCLRDDRQAGKVDHSLRELVAQRVFAIACGYPDANDSARLPEDPIHKPTSGSRSDRGSRSGFAADVVAFRERSWAGGH